MPFVTSEFSWMDQLNSLACSSFRFYLVITFSPFPLPLSLCSSILIEWDLLSIPFLSVLLFSVCYRGKDLQSDQGSIDILWPHTLYLARSNCSLSLQTLCSILEISVTGMFQVMCIERKGEVLICLEWAKINTSLHLECRINAGVMMKPAECHTCVNSQTTLGVQGGDLPL